MKRKKLLIITSIFAVCLIGVVAFGVKNKSNQGAAQGAANDANNPQYLEIQEETGSKFKGVSTISREQKVMVDKTQGEISEISVQEEQYVEKGTTLFTYYNAEVDDQVKDLDKQINNLNSKMKKQKAEAGSLPNEQQGDGSQENLNELISKRDSLKKKVTKAVTAEIDGVVYIDQNAKNDSTKEFIRVVSKDALIVSEASEFDIDSLKVDEPVKIKVISNGEKINGKIIKINNLPSTGDDKKSITYKFQIKPEKEIRVGFSVEVGVKPQKIKIPKEYVVVENDKTFVNVLEKDGKSKKVEVKTSKDGEDYSLEDQSIKSGDKLVINPSENVGEEK